MRDVRSMASKLKYVMSPSIREDRGRRLKDWDLWGPLILCLSLGVILQQKLNDDPEQASNAFVDIFITMWAGSAVVTLNAVLLRGKVSFFQCVCVLGYCICPLVLSALGTYFMRNLGWDLLKVLVVGAGLCWATWAAMGFIEEMVPPDKKLLGAYPVGLFYIAIAWMVLLA